MQPPKKDNKATAKAAKPSSGGKNKKKVGPVFLKLSFIWTCVCLYLFYNIVETNIKTYSTEKKLYFFPFPFSSSLIIHSVKQKWSKGKVKDKANNAVTFDKATFDKLFKEVPTAKLITPSVLVDRLRINASLARAAIAELENKGLIKRISTHRSQLIYTRATKADAEIEAAA